jgi:prevent-host-death family protein
MKITSVANAKMKLSQHIADSHKEPVLITKNGKPAAMLLPVAEDADVESLALAFSPRFQELIRKSQAQAQRGETIPHDQFWAELEAEKDAAAPSKRPRAAKAATKPGAQPAPRRKRTAGRI